MKEAGAAAPELVRRFDTHDAECEEPGEQRARNRAALIHVTGERTDLPVGELIHAVVKESFVIGQRGERRQGHASDVSTGNGCRTGRKRLR